MNMYMLSCVSEASKRRQTSRLRFNQVKCDPREVLVSHYGPLATVGSDIDDQVGLEPRHSEQFEHIGHSVEPHDGPSVKNEAHAA